MQLDSDNKITSSLKELGNQDNQFDSLYRRVSATFEMSACSMWIFYYLLLSDDGMTQLEMTEAMMFPKQTINSAVSQLAKGGMVTLEAVPGTRNSKKVLLTKQGKKLAEKTASRLLSSEIKVAQKFGEEKMMQFITLREEYLALLKAEVVGGARGVLVCLHNGICVRKPAFVPPCLQEL